ncbi:cyanophycinase, partial [Pseudidiomarina sp.]|uniref:cyanophycinase n=1 Tax=Pseudidiomarina sp. TaxID=2081707 RepID=UPI00299CF3EB
MRTPFFSILAAAMSLAVSGPAAAQNDQPTTEAAENYQLVLIGGELRACTSMASNRCDETGWIDTSTMRTDRFLNLTDRYINPLLHDDLWPTHRRETRDQLAAALDTIKNRVKEDVLPERVFQDEFTRRVTKDLYDNLSNREWDMIIDHLEMPVQPNRRIGVKLDESLNKSAPQLMNEFMAQVRNVADGKPRVLVVTAAARDALNAADYYESLLKEGGADTTWLPIDAAVNAAQRGKRCDKLDELRIEHHSVWNRARVHSDRHQQQLEFCKSPDAGVKMVAEADAIFFADGDQHRLRNALLNPLSQPTDLLTAIYRRMLDNQLVVGGENAAAIAMTGRPLITNGTSRMAMKEGARSAQPPTAACNLDDSCPRDLNPDSLTYHPLGGLGLFPYATLDAEFADKGRHARLMRLAATTQTQVGVGIDDETMLLVNVLNDKFKVSGKRGVTFIIGAQDAATAVASTFHYLTDGAYGDI